MEKSSIFGNKYRIDSARWQNWDYREVGWYFVTVCISERRYEFGYIENGKMMENNNAELCRTAWNDLTNHFSSIRLDTFVIMPDHVHFILEITNRTKHNLGDIVCGFKSKTTKLINEEKGHNREKFWQSRFYDHIIRSPGELAETRKYIIDNPRRWKSSVETRLAASLAKDVFDKYKKIKLNTETHRGVSLQNSQL